MDWQHPGLQGWPLHGAADQGCLARQPDAENRRAEPGQRLRGAGIPAALHLAERDGQAAQALCQGGCVHQHRYLAQHARARRHGVGADQLCADHRGFRCRLAQGHVGRRLHLAAGRGRHLVARAGESLWRDWRIAIGRHVPLHSNRTLQRDHRHHRAAGIPAPGRGMAEAA